MHVESCRSATAVEAGFRFITEKLYVHPKRMNKSLFKGDQMHIAREIISAKEKERKSYIETKSRGGKKSWF